MAARRQRAARYDDYGQYAATPATSPAARTDVGRRSPVVERRTIHVEDLSALIETEYPDCGSTCSGATGPHGLNVPFLREGERRGHLAAAQRGCARSADEEIALLQTFADQAVIAIENVRLFNETKEALEQQTATAESCRSSANSLTDVQPVFDTSSRAASTCFAGEQLGLVLSRRRPDATPSAVGAARRSMSSATASFRCRSRPRSRRARSASGDGQRRRR